ncbi:MAG: acyl-CoA/acyl-ACP dehydrogenase [Deltaproteobacteria bacterium]|nr:acyl-CoA/acyl-ACP dehydrogenase [Deltaproteobacteria bacterium]
MNLDYTKEQDMLRKSVDEFLSKECPFDDVREIEDSESGFSAAKWKKMAKLGWMELYFPEEYGGLGDPFGDVAIIMEEMGKKAFPSPFFSTVIQCGLILLAGGSDKQKKELLPKIAAGKLIMSLAQLEEEGSYRATGINLPAQRTAGGFILNGIKMFAMDANIADKLIVAARVVEEGIALFLVDAKDPGINYTKMDAIGKDNLCRVTFKDVKVGDGDLIGGVGEGWEILEQMAQKATLAKCAEMLGGCAESIEMTNAYAKQREQYSTPIGGFQAIQHYMADMQIAYDTSLYYMQKVAWMMDEGMDTTKELSALKAQVNEKFKFITERAVQIHGGIGTTREFNIGLFYRRAKAHEYIMGDTDYHYAKLAEALEL